MANTLTVDQASSILNEAVAQATGKNALGGVNAGDFTTIATTALQCGYDVMLNAITQVLQRTIFSIRPYYAKFKGMEMDSNAWGAITRKINYIDRPAGENAEWQLTDGQSIDQWKVNKPKVLQTNFYGYNTFMRDTTIFENQMNLAFSNAEEFARFASGVIQNINDMIEQDKEAISRMTLGNAIAGTIASGGTVIHLLTEYNADTGLTLKATDINKPANFEAFYKWVYARIAVISDMLTERTLKHHINVTGKEITRHTPYADQRLYLFSPTQRKISSMLLANTFNKELLEYADHESVNYWQSYDKPDSINIKASYMDAADGTIKTEEQAKAHANIFGVIMDREMCGINMYNNRVATTPLNAKGLYWNQFWHYTLRWYNDFTENCVVFLLD